MATPLADLAGVPVHSTCYGVSTGPEIHARDEQGRQYDPCQAHPLGMEHWTVDQAGGAGLVAHSTTACTMDVLPGSWLHKRKKKGEASESEGCPKGFIISWMIFWLVMGLVSGVAVCLVTASPAGIICLVVAMFIACPTMFCKVCFKLAQDEMSAQGRERDRERESGQERVRQERQELEQENRGWG